MKKTRNILWIFLNSALAALGGGTLAFGVLELSPLMAAVVALGFALSIGALWGWALRASLRTRILSVITLISVFALGWISLAQLRGARQILVNTANRLENFKQLCVVMQAHYPYFEQKNVDWDAACHRYEPLVQAAQTDFEYHALIANLLAKLGDAHTGLLQPRSAPHHYFGRSRLLSDGMVLVEPGEAARQAGLERGAEILAVDGLPTAEALLVVPLPLRSGSTPWQSRAWAAFHLLSTPEGTLTVTYRNPGGEARTVTLHWVETTMPILVDKPMINGEILPSGWGLMRLPTFSRNTGHDLIAEFDRAVKQVRAAPGLILDLRGNGGGDSHLAGQIAGRFFIERFCYGYDRFRQRLPVRGWSLRFEYCIQPRGETITLPIILLIDSSNMSSAEQFITAFTESDRAITLGERTGGASGNPFTFPLSGGGLIRFSTGAFYTRSGLLLEGAGIQPDLSIPSTVADFQDGLDPVLLQAQQLDPAQISRLQNPIAP